MEQTGNITTVDLQIAADTIINADVKSDAAITQNKLAMTPAGTYDINNASTLSQANLGVATFNEDEFTATGSTGTSSLGIISLKDGGITAAKLANVNQNQVLARTATCLLYTSDAADE